MDELKPCPFCGSANVHVVTRDVEPQGDPWYGRKDETFAECKDCGCTLFDRAFHEGFCNKSNAIAAWNSRAPEGGKG